MSCLGRCLTAGVSVCLTLGRDFGFFGRRCSAASSRREAGIGAGCVVGGRAAVWTRFGRCLAGATVTEVAAQVGVSRQSVHAWVGRYLSRGCGGAGGSVVIGRSRVRIRRRRRWRCAVAEMRREHPRWGAEADPAGAAARPPVAADGGAVGARRSTGSCSATGWWSRGRGSGRGTRIVRWRAAGADAAVAASTSSAG